MKHKRLKVYFSLRSPYSWLALRQLHEHRPDAPSIFEYLPVWEPGDQLGRDLHACGSGVHYQSMSKAKHRYIVEDVTRLAQHLGCSVRWPRDGNQQWDLPHRVWLASRRTGMHHALLSALQEARWQQGLDITDPAVLATISNSCGFQGSELIEEAQTSKIYDEALSVLDEAYCDEAFGVPFFIIGRQRFFGIDRLGLVLDTMTKKTLTAHNDRPPTTLPAKVGSYDTDTAGGCG